MESLGQYDCVAIITGHSDYDYRKIADEAQLVAIPGSRSLLKKWRSRFPARLPGFSRAIPGAFWKSAVVPAYSSTVLPPIVNSILEPISRAPSFSRFISCRAALKSRILGRRVTLLHLNRFFRTFGAASNEKLRTNLCQSTTWMLFGKSQKVDYFKSCQIIDSSRLLFLSAPKVRKNQIKCEFTASRPPYAIENIRALVYALTENDKWSTHSAAPCLRP
jgi:hypothetical protein